MNRLETVTLFVKDLERSKTFYELSFAASSVYEDEVSWVFMLDNLMINLLQFTEASELIEPLQARSASIGPQMLLTIRVNDVDKSCLELRQKGVSLLNGPLDRPWGRRTAAFADPDGYVWELANEL